MSESLCPLERELLISVIRLEQPTAFVDVGAGEGATVEAVARATGVCCYALEEDAALAERCRVRLAGFAHLTVRNDHAFPLELRGERVVALVDSRMQRRRTDASLWWSSMIAGSLMIVHDTRFEASARAAALATRGTARAAYEAPSARGLTIFRK